VNMVHASYLILEARTFDSQLGYKVSLDIKPMAGAMVLYSFSYGTPLTASH